MRSIADLAPKWVLRTAGVLLLAQLALSLAFIGFVKGLPATRQFNMDGELNVPTWWSSAILVATGLVCIGLWLTGSRTGRPGAQWLVIAIGFLALSLEEVASIHEDIGSSVGGGSGGVSVWPLVYAPLAIAGVWMMLRAIRELPRPIAVVSVVGLASYVAVLAVEVLALGFESDLTVLLEENLEMLGTGLMFCALATELTRRFLALYPEPAPAPGQQSELAVEYT